MNWYRENRDVWRQIVETVAAEERRNVQMVEKDTLQSMFLLELSKSELPFVFKGGTSLSKAYDLIDRFSEDIDLSADRKLSETERREVKNTILETADDLGLKLTNPDMVMSRYSYNKYVFEYDSLFSDMPLEMIVETSFYQPVYPAENHEVYSIVGRFCQNRNISLPIAFEASIVKMKVQSLERTFINKVFAICDYRLQDMQDRDSRHLYDIAKILPQIRIDNNLKALVDKVRKDRMSSKNNPSAQPEHDIPKMLKEIIASRFYEPDYNNLTRKLLYDDVSYDEAVNNGIAVIADLDLFKYRT
ncbi:MAG: nucleotidyl transferase AbiEii/AbiGii toxin family protein [Erysipelotrichaceae bacterium]|nr:nucleotidyl transferase AbiEii/AbiGii toxin family protein [Erysipelotrichaceae bacterium]